MTWTNERREKQARAIMRWKPWEDSTGPKTEQGKHTASANSLKHGATSKAIKEALREAKEMDKQTREVLATIQAVILK